MLQASSTVHNRSVSTHLTHRPACSGHHANSAATSDRVDLGQVEYKEIQGLSHIAAGSVAPEEVDTAAERALLAEQMAAHMKAYPSLSAVITVVEGEQDGTTSVVVSSREDAVEQSVLEGVYEVNQRFASSDFVKQQAAQFPSQRHRIETFGGSETTHKIELPGNQDTDSVSKALLQGRQENRYDQVAEFAEEVVKGKGRRAVLVPGPSASGKTSLFHGFEEAINKAAARAGVEAPAVIQWEGDSYFIDADKVDAEGRADYPTTATGSHFWDHKDAMELGEMGQDIARGLTTGETTMPVYEWADAPNATTRPEAPGWRLDIDTTGFRRRDAVQEKEFPENSVLFIDSIHAAQPEVIEVLEKQGVDMNILYLDSPQAEHRLIRRTVRDFEKRGRSADNTLNAWEQSTFPGEVQSVRDQILEMDPAKDLAVNFRFPADLDMSYPEVKAQVAALNEYGLAPTYESLSTPVAELPALAQREEERLTAEIPRLEGKEKASAEAKLEALQKAPMHPVPQPNPEITAKLEKMIEGRPFHIPAEKATEMAETLGISIDQLLVELIPIGKQYAAPPQSEYQVAAAALTSSGDIVMGVNLEVGGEALNLTTHAEQSAVAQALATGSGTFEKLAISAAPCGHCRQVLNELSGAETLQVLVPGSPPRGLKDYLLPEDFGPKDLGVDGGLLGHEHGHFQLVKPSDDKTVLAALQAAEKSYSPYTNPEGGGSPSGVAIQTKDGEVYAAPYYEVANFNGSLGPLPNALAFARGDGVEFDDIARVVLVEREQVNVRQASQQGITELALKSHAPNAEFEVHHLKDAESCDHGHCDH